MSSKTAARSTINWYNASVRFIHSDVDRHGIGSIRKFQHEDLQLVNVRTSGGAIRLSGGQRRNKAKTSSTVESGMSR